MKEYTIYGFVRSAGISRTQRFHVRTWKEFEKIVKDETLAIIKCTIEVS